MNEKPHLRIFGFAYRHVSQEEFLHDKEAQQREEIRRLSNPNQAVNFTLQFPEFIIVSTVPTLAHCLFSNKK